MTRSAWPAVVADLMKEHGVSERTLSKRTGINRTSLRRFLEDAMPLRIDRLERILAEFGCDLEALPIVRDEAPTPSIEEA